MRRHVRCANENRCGERRPGHHRHRQTKRVIRGGLFRLPEIESITEPRRRPLCGSAGKGEIPSTREVGDHPPARVTEFTRRQRWIRKTRVASRVVRCRWRWPMRQEVSLQHQGTGDRIASRDHVVQLPLEAVVGVVSPHKRAWLWQPRFRRSPGTPRFAPHEFHFTGWARRQRPRRIIGDGRRRVLEGPSRIPADAARVANAGQMGKPNLHSARTARTTPE